MERGRGKGKQEVEGAIGKSTWEERREWIKVWRNSIGGGDCEEGE